MRYVETTDAYAQIRKLENYIQRFKNGQNYLELEAIVKNKVGEFLLGNERLLESSSLCNSSFKKEPWQISSH
jgi:hypothetical protein